MAPTSQAPAPARPGQTKRRDGVIAAAAALAEAGGYDAVTMKTVADRSGVALATIYRWFESKDHLLAEALLAWVKELDATLRATPLVEPTPADRMATMMRTVGDGIAERPLLVSAAITALLADDPAVLALAVDFHHGVEGWIDLAAGPDPIAHRADATELLEHVIFSSLIALVRGSDTPESVSDRLQRAARLLLG